MHQDEFEKRCEKSGDYREADRCSSSHWSHHDPYATVYEAVSHPLL